MIGKHRILVGDVMDGLRMLADGSVHCCITSPPYWGLRDYKAGETMIGLEPTPEEHIARLVAVFREVRRVLRDDGTCWLNYGDAYAGVGGMGAQDGGPIGATAAEAVRGIGGKSGRSGDLLMLPHRLAFALQSDGWWVRSAIVWAKGVSFCDSYSGAVMPESVSGWRWEKCRVKVAPQQPARLAGLYAAGSGNPRMRPGSGGVTGTMPPEYETQWSDCPGCEKCAANDGLVLRKGRWRPTSAYEMVFLLAKSERYYCDQDAVKEKAEYGYTHLSRSAKSGIVAECRPSPGDSAGSVDAGSGGSRNLRNVWTIGTEPYDGAHFATYPTALVEPIVKVATPEKGVCSSCWAPWARVVQNAASTIGWRATCTCVAPTRPAVVLDPFMGSGTTALVACGLGRDAIGIELNPKYAAMAEDRIGKGLRPSTYRSNKIEDATLFEGG